MGNQLKFQSVKNSFKLVFMQKLMILTSERHAEHPFAGRNTQQGFNFTNGPAWGRTSVNDISVNQNGDYRNHVTL